MLVMENLQVERLSQVGNGRHLRLRLQSGSYGFNAIFFSNTAESASIAQGDFVDVAFAPQVNEFRGERTVQMNLQDIRPACKVQVNCETDGYRRLRSGNPDRATAENLLPDRATLGMVYRYLSAQNGAVEELPACLCRKIVRWSGMPLDLGKMLVCLDIFADVGLLELGRVRKAITVRLLPAQGKADLETSATMQLLKGAI
jgi:single-stranded-DNA-specific exonuclease